MEGTDPVLTAPVLQRGRAGPLALRPVARAALVVLAVVGLGKVAGFAREVVVVARFGASAPSDGFFTAYALFNVVWVMALATSLAPAVVPSLARIEASGDSARRRQTAALYAGIALAFGAALALLAFLFAEPVIRVTAPELSPEATAAGGVSLRILSLAIVPVVLAGVLGAILQAHDRFVAAASSTLIVSATMVAFTLGVAGGIEVVSVGVLVGSVLQLLVLVPDLHAVRPLARSRAVDLAEARAVGERAVPVSGLTGLVAVRPALERSFAADFGTGLVTLVALGSRTGSFFASLIGTALATAVFPRLSRDAARNDSHALAATVRFAISFTVLTSLPVAAGALLLSGDAATLLFRHGSVTAQDASLVAGTMAAYAPAILLSPLVDVLARIRYARGDMWTPLAATALGLVLNAAALLAAYRIGLAAFGVGFTVNVLFMLVILGWRERRLARTLMPRPGALLLAIMATVAALGVYTIARAAVGDDGGAVALLPCFLAAGAAYVAVVGPGLAFIARR